MKRTWMAIGMVSLFFMGCMAMEPTKVREEKYGKNVPAITNSFASKEIRPGDTWKVYLTAQDNDGDMKNIIAIVEQPGVGTYPVGITRIKGEGQKEISGYVYLFTAGATNFNLVNLMLHVQIVDRAGHYSALVSFPLSFNELYTQEAPPKGAFPEKDLGPIMIQLRTFQDGSSATQDW